MRIFLALFLLVAVRAQAVDFPMQSRTFYATGAACCVAQGPGGIVYAGTAQGLVALRNGSWDRVDGSPAAAVDQLWGDASGLVFTAGGKTFQLTPAGAVIPATSHPEARTVKGPHGLIARAAVDGLYENGAMLFPRDGARSWRPVDVRGAAYDARGRLHFASPQGVGFRDGAGWHLYTVADGLPYDDFTAVAPAEDGSVWYGTRMGAIHFDGKHWEYRQGLRWLPSDEIRGMAAVGNHVYIATPAGIGVITTTRTTLAAKARYFEDAIDQRHRRTEYGYVLGVRVAKAGDASQWTQSDSDNDGLWTSMYGAGECFACATGDEAGCRRAEAAFEALRFLGTVTQGGPHPAPRGFVARAILPASGRNPNLGDTPERDRRQREHDPLWKIMNPRWPLSADGRWYWKSDTSSDELDGHFFFYALYYDLAAKTAQQKQRVREHVAAIADHLVDHDFQLIDYDGAVTRWGVFNPANLNHNPDWAGDRTLNSTSILSYLKAAEHITGDPKYGAAARTLIEQHGYAMNTLIPKDSAGPGSGNQSDDEMAFMCFYNLLKYETDPRLHAMYAAALRNRWNVERWELNPLFNYLAGATLTPEGGWREESLDTLRRYPLGRFNWALKNSHRKDIALLPEYANDAPREVKRGYRRSGFVLPIDERYVDQWNHDPWRLDYQGDGRHLADGASFLLPYYMGRYYRFFAE